jgi:hypothetical protein
MFGSLKYLLALAPLLTGCGRDDVQVYRVGKDQAPAQPLDQAQAATLPAGHPDMSAAASAPLKWKTPAGWEEVTPGEMRLASFRVKGQGGKQADVGVFPLPGMAGRDLDNVNRWRGQVGLAPITEAELPKLAQTVEIGGQSGQLYDLGGQNPASGDKTRILAALVRREGMAWFFKMNGDDNLVEEQKPTFVEFLKTLSFQGAGTPMELPPSHPSIGGAGATAPGAAAMSASSEPKPIWQVPAGWQEGSAGPFLVAKFTMPGAEAPQTSVNVSMSAGEGGGLVGNVNRWRGQLGLEQLSEADINKLVTPVDTGGGKAILIDMTGTDARSGQKARLVGAIVSQPERTWFYKLMGNEQIVAREKDNFTTFVKTAKYP